MALSTFPILIPSIISEFFLILAQFSADFDVSNAVNGNSLHPESLEQRKSSGSSSKKVSINVSSRNMTLLGVIRGDAGPN